MKRKNVMIDKHNFLCMYGGRKLYECMHGLERHQPQKWIKKKKLASWLAQSSIKCSSSV